MLCIEPSIDASSQLVPRESEPPRPARDRERDMERETHCISEPSRKTPHPLFSDKFSALMSSRTWVAGECWSSEVMHQEER